MGDVGNAQSMETGAATSAAKPEDLNEALFDFNNLRYDSYPDLSLISERTFKNAYFQRNQYDQSTTGYCVLNSGSDFIDGRNSYLTFNLNVTNTAAVNNANEYPTWGQGGSAFNLIRRIVLTDRAGNELERVENVNYLVNALMNLQESKDYFDTYATQFAHERTQYDEVVNNATYISPTPSTQWKQLIVPPPSEGNHWVLTASATDAGTIIQFRDSSAPGTAMKIPLELEDDTLIGKYIKIGNLVFKFLGYTVDVGGHISISPNVAYGDGVIAEVDGTQFFVSTVGTGETSAGPGSYGGTLDLSRRTTTWILPMYLLSGLFNFKNLLPAQLMSGLRIELQFEDLNNAFKFVRTPVKTNTPPLWKYTIDNPRFVLDSCKLTDMAQRGLNEQAATNGLEINYRTWFSTPQTIIGSTSIVLESRKAVSRAFQALTMIYPKYASSVQKYYCNFVPGKFDVSKWQYRAGNLYFPNQALSTTYPSNSVPYDVAKETFNHTMRLLKKNKETWYTPSQSVENWTHEKKGDIVPTAYQNVYDGTDNRVVATENDANDYNLSYCTLPVDMERSTVQDLSGLPLNNSRVLALEASTNSSSDKNVILFLQHMKIARVFIDNSEVEE